jgi:hypothetical protein
MRYRHLLMATGQQGYHARQGESFDQIPVHVVPHV